MKFKVKKVKLKNSIQKLKISLNFAFLIFIFALFLTGCGYKVLGRESLPFDSVNIGRIENKTYEPKLEDKLQKALADELIRNGIMISKNSGYVITGVINDFKLEPLTETQGTAVEFEIVIKGRFFLTSPEGKVKELRNSGVFIVSFYSIGNLQELRAAKEQAAETAMRNLASEIRAGIVYGI